MGFEIQLEKKQTDPLTTLERAINKLSNRMSNLEKKTANLNEESLDQKLVTYFDGFEKRLFDALAGIEKRLTTIEEKNQKVDNKEAEFNTFSSYASCYKFSNNNKTLTATNSSGQKHVFTKDPLPKSKLAKLSFRIEDNARKGLGLGIAPFEVLNQPHPFKDSKAYLYYSAGNIWREGKNSGFSNPVPSKGDIVTFLVNNEKREIKVDINGTEVDTHKMKDDMQSIDLYGMAYTENPSGSVTLLSNAIYWDSLQELF